MKEIENVYNIILDETYNNQIILDIEISKITDKQLIVGMLVDLYSKEGYKADKEAIIQTMRNYCDIESFNLKECNTYFINQMKEYRLNILKSPSTDKLKQFLSILKDSMKQAVNGNITLSKNIEYNDFVKKLSNDEFEFIKNILLSQELYEEVNNIINIRG